MFDNILNFISNHPKKVSLRSFSRLRDSQNPYWEHEITIKVGKTIPEETLFQTEEELNVKFPESYRKFLKEVGSIELWDSQHESSYLLYNLPDFLCDSALYPTGKPMVSNTEGTFFIIGSSYEDSMFFAFKLHTVTNTLYKEVYLLGLDDEIPIYPDFADLVHELCHEENLGIAYFWIKTSAGISLNGHSEIIK